ncbi:dihydroorotate dehydrogenase electron transfer subunit [bacterium]|nr:dihydroorotate dehydrogenase electron transfer subunit [bacterium]
MTSCAAQARATILERDTLAAENFRLRLHCPEIAAQITPGQFFMLRAADRYDPLLGRPFALYDTIVDEHGVPTGIDVGIHAIGKMTELLEQIRIGEELEIWGPLGNGFPEIQTDHLIQVAGGIGYTPFVAVSREVLQQKTYRERKSSAKRASLVYGVRTQSQRANLSDWSDLPGLDVEICTEDGSEGRKGLVTEPLKDMLTQAETKPTVFTCGPVRMMHAVSELCREHDVECWVSLETPMACGYGACFSCVVPVTDDSAEMGWDYRRSCVEGPVFRGNDIVWDQLLS